MITDNKVLADILFYDLFVGIYVLAISFIGYGITRKHETDELG